MLRKGLVIYEPKGRAQEYCPLACNLYRGCGHGCIYCYAPDATFMDRQKFYEASPRPDIIDKLARDARKAADDGATGNVMLCFTCDPYQAIDDIHQLTRQAIQILHDNGFNVTVLTKGGHRAERDFDLYQGGDEFATTLTFTGKAMSDLWEPGAAPPEERIESLRKAHEKGIYTWVSLEPVIDPIQTLELIKLTHTFVDRFKVGKLNYAGILPAPFDSQVRGLDWGQFARAVIALFEQLGCDSYMKKDLRGYL